MDASAGCAIRSQRRRTFLFAGGRTPPHHSRLAGGGAAEGRATGAPHHTAGEPGRCFREAHRSPPEGGVMADLGLQTPPQDQELGVVNGRWAGYWAILGARMKELWREPEVIFWVFVFPLLLALGLGIAFRNKPADEDGGCRGHASHSSAARSPIPAAEWSETAHARFRASCSTSRQTHGPEDRGNRV